MAKRNALIASTGLIVVLSLVASLAGVLSHGHDRYRTFTTARGETVEVQDLGAYRYSVRALVTGGRPWDFIRLLIGIPLLAGSCLFHLRGSVRGTVLFVGSLASFLYQYLLWTFAWAYGSLFLVYVAVFSLSLWTLVLVLARVDLDQVRTAIGPRFPAKWAACFSFAVAGMLFVKCLREIVPTVGSSAMPSGAAGYYTMVDQALDLGLLAPFCLAVGILLLKRRALGYLLSASSLILFLTVGLSVTAGEIVLGLSTGRVKALGLAVFGTLVAAALLLLVLVLRSIRLTRRSPH